MHTDVHCGFSHNSPKQEATQMFSNSRIDKCGLFIQWNTTQQLKITLQIHAETRLNVTDMVNSKS